MSRTDEIIKWVKGPTVLDIGCTDHIVLNNSIYWVHGYLYNLFPHVVGIDISEENLEKMRSMGYENLYNQNAESFELSDRYDTIVAGELIEHLSNPGMFLERVRKHLKPYGRLVLTTPYVFSPLYIFYSILKYPKTCQNDQHTTWFCLQTLRTLFQRYGFIEEYFELIPDYHLDDPSRKYRIFIKILLASKFLLPGRFWKNCMLFVLRPVKDHTVLADDGLSTELLF